MSEHGIGFDGNVERTDRQSLLEHGRLLLESTSVKLNDAGRWRTPSFDVDFLESLVLYLMAVQFYLERAEVAGHTEPCLANPPTEPPPSLPGEARLRLCAFCGRYCAVANGSGPACRVEGEGST
jgi:hypothetical protein